jgi:hypothetical protein
VSEVRGLLNQPNRNIGLSDRINLGSIRKNESQSMPRAFGPCVLQRGCHLEDLVFRFAPVAE